MKCEYCGKIATDKHHIIFRSAGGNNTPYNLIHLCRSCHYSIHHGKDIDKKNKILKFCYDYIRPNIDKCWDKEKAKYKPKIVRLIECGEL